MVSDSFYNFLLLCLLNEMFVHVNRFTSSTLQFIITARVAKRAKVMFSRVCVTHSVQRGGGGGGEVGNTKGHNTTLPPPGTRSQHLPPPWDQVTTPPPPGPGHNTPPSWDQATTPPPPPKTRSQHLPPSLPPPPGSGHNTSLPSPPPGPGHNNSLPPPPPPGTMRRRAVRILLECILVCLLCSLN